LAWLPFTRSLLDYVVYGSLVFRILENTVTFFINVMNPVYLHLVSNHFPLCGVLFGLLLLVLGIAFRSRGLRNGSHLLLIFSAIMTFVVVVTGEKAADIVLKLPQISEAQVEAHEEAAETAALFMYLTGGLATLALVSDLFFGAADVRQKWSNRLSLLPCLAAAVGAATMIPAAFYGGEIIHKESRQVEQRTVDKTSEVPPSSSSPTANHEGQQQLEEPVDESLSSTTEEN
jgi:uncharacterized membrane protein